MSAWLFLFLAIAFEVLRTAFLKLSSGFEKPFYGALAIAAYSGSFWFFAPAIKVIPVGVAYAIWAGVGILAAAIIGAAFFGQHLNLMQYAFIAMILAGAIGLRLTTAV